MLCWLVGTLPLALPLVLTKPLPTAFTHVPYQMARDSPELDKFWWAMLHTVQVCNSPQLAEAVLDGHYSLGDHPDSDLLAGVVAAALTEGCKQRLVVVVQ
jgi:hypothetical protein